VIVDLIVNCIECDAEIVHRSLHVSDGEVPQINVDEFSQSDWVCPNCGHTTCIGDIDMMDQEELFDGDPDAEDEEDES
jgi:hypothetical protein